MTNEKLCLVFCYNTASRCRSIVYDQAKHICHFFMESDIDMTLYARRMNFIRVVDPTCFRDITENVVKAVPFSGDIKQQESNYTVSSLATLSATTTVAPVVTTTTITTTPPPPTSTTTKAPETTTKPSSKESIKAYYEKVIKSETMKSGASRVGGPRAVAVGMDGSPDVFEKMASNAEKMMPKVSGFKAVRRPVSSLEDKSVDERGVVRRKEANYNLNTDTGKPHLTGDGDKINGFALLTPFELNESTDIQILNKETKTLIGYSDCEEKDIKLWIGIENSEFQPKADDERFIIMDSNTDSVCKRKCEKTNCDVFTFAEKDSSCRLHYGINEESANEVIKQIVPSFTNDFSSRTFKQLCYPPNLSAFTQCNDIMAFLDYTINKDPREVFSGLPKGADGVLNCIELCLLTKSFLCNSATFDMENGECKLFDEDSITAPKLFKQLPSSNLIYFENSCNLDQIPDGRLKRIMK
uniref:Apple domain-containing protein n=1 Tax=Rhabditophanes sp. KR3021 TaxID=114890 RepID=A0AC35U2W0_9BILA